MAQPLREVGFAAGIPDRRDCGAVPSLPQSAGPVGTGRRIVVDTKSTSIVATGVTTGRAYCEQTFKSDNIYQIYAYLRSQEESGDPLWRTAAGVLLYPSLGIDHDAAGIIQGHEIRFATVDLGAGSQTIRRQLLRIVDGSPALERGAIR